MITYRILFCLILWLTGCQEHVTTPTFKTYRVTYKTLDKTLHFTGIVQPLHESSITTPADGTIEAMHYRYGQRVAKHAIVMTVNSPDIERLYNDTMTEYLKAKDSYAVAQTKFSGTESLWQSGLLSKNNYLSERSSLNTEHVTLMQATRKISELLEKMGLGSSIHQELDSLSFSEFDKVHLTLMSKHNLIQLKSPRHGILLYPPQSESDKFSRLRVGSSVKTGQVLALIGDMRGFRIEIEVPEIDLNQLHPGMPATVHGIGFNQHVFLGKLIAINAQASHKHSTLLPSFSAVVEVKPLSQKAQHIIRVGMSANIDIPTQKEHKLLVPIQALIQEHHQTFLYVQHKHHPIEKRRIRTGLVEGEWVIIESGIHEGEIIQYETPS